MVTYPKDFVFKEKRAWQKLYKNLSKNLEQKSDKPLIDSTLNISETDSANDKVISAQDYNKNVNNEKEGKI